jgi:diguanylate cyclase (GGDEF)-like protein
MNPVGQIARLSKPLKELGLYLVAAVTVLGVARWLRSSPYVADPEIFKDLQIACAIMAFSFAGAALVRFRGTRDRVSLFLAFGFLLSGIATLGSVTALSLDTHSVHPEALAKAPVLWWLSRVLLGLILLAALVLERRAQRAQNPASEILVTLVLTAGFAILLSAFYGQIPDRWLIQPRALISRPSNLVLAGIFLLAALGFRRRLRMNDSPYDRGIYFAAALNVACHLATSQSEELMDAPFLFGQVLKSLSYAVVLGGSFLENVRLFDQVRLEATVDPLTGLANYRSLRVVLENEIQRCGRTGREFSVLLLDLDKLKAINDQYGHLAGNRALVRVANVLRMVCRSTDTTARHGGDEFAVVLPESGEAAARALAERILEYLSKDLETPQISVSIGMSIYPVHGSSLEALLAAADKSLYEMKHSREFQVAAS